MKYELEKNYSLKIESEDQFKEEVRKYFIDDVVMLNIIISWHLFENDRKLILQEIDIERIL